MKKRNKKGYIRTIEAILAILVVFAFVVTILPKKTAEIAKAPPELDSTMRSILEEAQNNEEFRTCLLLNNNVELEDSTKNMVKNSQCLKDQLDKALPAFTLWDYGFAICDGTATDNCVMYDTENSVTNTEKIKPIVEIALPKDKTVYTKSSVIAVPDVVARPFLVNNCCAGVTLPLTSCGTPSTPNCCELNERINPTNMPGQTCISKGKTIYLYLWNKQ